MPCVCQNNITAQVVPGQERRWESQERRQQSNLRNGLLGARSFPTTSLKTHDHPVMQGSPSLEREGN